MLRTRFNDFKLPHNTLRAYFKNFYLTHNALQWG